MCKTRLTSLRDYCIIKLLRAFTHVVKALIFLLLTESSGCIQPRELLQLTGPIRKIGSKTKGNNNVVYSCKYHVVWSPKYRRKVLVNGVDVRLKALIEEVCNDYHIDIIEMEIMPDHGRHLYDLCCSRNAG